MSPDRKCPLRRPRLVLALLAALGFGSYATVIEPASIHVESHPVAMPGEAFKGLRIAVISDLHGGAPYIGTAKIDRIVQLTNGARPDLILLTGDYVVTGVKGGRHMPIESIVAHLKPLHARLGVYAVIGNHDRWENAGHIAHAFETQGIPILENASVPLGPFDLVGLGDAYSHAARPAIALQHVMPGRSAICFTHSPDVFPHLSPICRLTIAGHTHGGQVRLPLLGRPAVAAVSHFGQRFAIGTIRDGDRTLFVSPGIGVSGLPIRFGVPPEISLLTIR